MEKVQQMLNDYFKHLCKACCFARKQEQYFIKRSKESKVPYFDRDKESWSESRKNIQHEIEKTLGQSSRNNIRIKVSEADEVKCLISFLASCKYPEKFDNIDVSMMVYNKKKYCRDFCEAYCLGNYAKIKKMKKIF